MSSARDTTLPSIVNALECVAALSTFSTIDTRRLNGTQILEMSATDLIGRLVITPNGAESVVTALTFDARTALVVLEIDEIHEGSPAGLTSGVWSLKGWTVANRL